MFITELIVSLRLISGKMLKEECKRQLIEDMGIHFESQYNLPPLAARIYAGLILSEEDGTTFEDCQIKRQASKSSISTSLNLLLKIGMITYFTKSGDRKRYFKTTDKNAFFLAKLEENLKKVERERKIVEKVGAYIKEYNPKKHKENIGKSKIFQSFLQKNETLLKEAINEIKNLNK